MKFVVHRLKSCASTNDVARALAEAGAPEGTVVVSEEQTAGRGTKGRAWDSPPRLGLYASFVTRRAFPKISLLPIAIGLAVVDAVEAACGLVARLRWPNDVFFEGKKLGGVLCESGFTGSRPDFFVLGVGINVNQDAADFPGTLAGTAVSLKIARGGAVDPGILFDAIRPAVARRLAELQNDPDGLVRAFGRRSADRPGDVLLLSVDGTQERFIYQGIDADGALLVCESGGAPRRFLSADVRKVL